MLRAGPALVVLSVLLPAAIFALAAWHKRRDLERNADVQVERALRILLEHAVKVFETHKLVIDQVNVRLHAIDWNNPADLDDASKVLKGLADDLEQVTTVTVVDAAGRLRLSSLAHPADHNITFADRDWFVALRAADQKLPFVSRSYMGRQSKQPIFNVAGRIKTADGSFQGAIAVSVNRSYFEAFYRAVEPSPENVVSLVRRDGQVLARLPFTKMTTMQQGGAFFHSLTLKEGTVFEATSAIDGAVRLYAYRQVGTYPVFIGFGLSKSSLLAVWRAHVAVYGLIAMLASLALLFCSGLAMRENRRERLASERWRAAAAQLEAEARERERIEEHLRQSQKMEAVGQLTSGIAHDFNNMLGATIGSLDLLRHRMKAGGLWDERAQRCVDNAMEGAWRAVNLTQRLLAFSRTQVMQPRGLDVNALIEGMSDLIRRSINEDVRIETRLAERLWTTYADPNQLESAILNLVINARDAMPGGGRLTLETRNCEPGEPADGPALGSNGEPGPFIMIAVADTGSGMSEEVVARAFDPFFTTKASGKGTGLGLSQVHGFVKQSHGFVRVDSQVGRGTKVEIYLPKHAAVGHAPIPGRPEPSPPATAGPGQNASAIPPADPASTGPIVLVVEDEPQLRRVSAEAFRQLGYRVLEASGPVEALTLLQGAPPVALLFTDVVMPEMNGATLAEKVRHHQPGIRTLFTTGYTKDAIVHNGVLDPTVDLIAKPFTVGQLLAKVDEVLGRAAAAAA